MSDENLGAYQEPVRFNWAAAESLVTQLRALAQLLEEQVGARNGFAADALDQWRGAYAGKFEGRMQICTGDALKFAGAMKRMALQVDELARLAREEQERRNLAKQWKREHDEWQRQRDARNVFEVARDGVAEIFVEDDAPDPPDPPKPVLQYTSEAPPQANRG